MSVPQRLALHLEPGDVVGYEGQWRKVSRTHLQALSSGGLVRVLAWEGGGALRIPVGDWMLILPPGTQPAKSYPECSEP